MMRTIRRFWRRRRDLSNEWAEWGLFWLAILGLLVGVIFFLAIEGVIS
jgi:hypothetical protein